MSSRVRPSDRVCSAYGVVPTEAVNLPGGRGLAWRAGHIVLRPFEGGEENAWKAGVLARLQHTSEFRTPRPVRTRSGSWSEEGWEAWEWVPGTADESRVDDILRAARSFHSAISHLERPGFIDDSDDPWSRADRVAWGEEATPVNASVKRLVGAFLPVSAASQLVHGDLLGNVLFAQGQPPTIIDWAPYWRPARYADAIVIADACWHELPLTRMRALVDGIPEGRQLLLRALTFRIATLTLRGAWDAGMRERHEPILRAALDEG
ncbi:phosphotransferase [Microbacterium sp. NPDC057944]|uniref:phosphotransferase n=1 Tax=Microbacterium sp. NPDC057944 TaxID=3346286 RepID=UPI0036DC0C01